MLSAAVESKSFWYETAPHKIIYDFNEDVSASLSDEDLNTENLNTAATILTDHTYDSAQHKASFAVTGYSNGVLSKGNYQSTIFADAVHGTDGVPLPDDANLDFFFLPADANHDRLVGQLDFNAYSANNGQSGRTFSQGDFNYDGNVNIQDFNILSSNYGSTLPATPAPGSLAIGEGNGAHGLSWSAWPNTPSDITGYRIQRSSDGQNFTTYADLIDPTASFFLDDGDADPAVTGPKLPPGTRYWYRVRAIGGALGGTSYTAKQAGTTVMPPPENVQATATSPTTAYLTWNDVTPNEVRFEVRVMDPNGNILRTDTNVPPNNPGATGGYSVLNLQPGTTYMFSMSAWGPGGKQSIWTLPTSPIATPATQPLTAPTSASATLLSPGMIGVSWTDNSNNEEGFAIERAVGTGAFEEIFRTDAGVTSYVLTDPDPATSHRFQVRAFNAGGTSAYSPVASATTLPVPTGVTASVVNEQHLRVSWTAPAGASDFEIERTDSAGNITTLIASASAREYDDEGRTDGTTYTYTVAFRSGGITSRHSAEATATTPLYYPVSINAVQDPDDSTKINITWTDRSQTEDTYEVEYAEYSSELELLTVLDANAGSATAEEIIAGKTYQFRVRAVSSEAGPSEWGWWTTETTLPAPTALTADAVSDREINLKWTDESDTETGFKIAYKKFQDPTYKYINDVPLNAQGYTFTGLEPDTLYRFSVQALIGEGGYASAPTNEVSARTEMPPEPPPPMPGPYMVFIGGWQSGETLMTYVSGELKLQPHDPIDSDTPDEAVKAPGVINGGVTIKVNGTDTWFPWDGNYDVWYDYDPNPDVLQRGPLKWDPEACAYVGYIGLEDFEDGDYDDWLWPVWVMPDCGKPRVGIFTDDADGSEDPESPGSGGPPNPVKFTVHRLDPTPFGELTVDFHSLAGDAEVGFDKDYQLFVKRDSGETPITPDEQRRFSLTFQDQETALEVIVKPVDNGVFQPTRSILGMLAAGATYTTLSFLTNAMLVKDNEVVPDIRIDSNNDGTVDAKDNKIEARRGTTGLVVPANTNDTDGNGFPDYLDPVPLGSDDPDLMEMLLDVPQRAGAAGKVKLKVQSSAGSELRVWLDRRKSGSALLDRNHFEAEWDLGQHAAHKKVYIEGVKAGAYAGDSLFTLEFTANQIPGRPAPEAISDAAHVSIAPSDPVIVGFYGADTVFTFPNDGNLAMRDISQKLVQDGFEHQIFKSFLERDLAKKWLKEVLDYNNDGKYDPGHGDPKRDIRIFGHSWGGLSSIQLAQTIQSNFFFKEKTVDMLATIDPVKTARAPSDWFGGIPSNVRWFWNKYESKTFGGGVVINLGLWKIYPHGSAVPSQAQGGPPQANLNWDGLQKERDQFIYGNYVAGTEYFIDHFNIIGVVRSELITLLESR